MSDGKGRGPLLAAVAAAGALAVLAVAFAGPVRVGAPRWALRPVMRTVAPPRQTVQPALPHMARGGTGGAHVVAIVVEIVLALGVALLLALLVRWLLRRLRDRRRLVRGAARDEDATALATADVDAVAAPVVRRGIERALQILDDETRPPRDAVVAAWLGLEETAVLAGARRGPAETPTEYAGRIIRRFDADGAAAAELVLLYQDVRFGARDVDRAAVARARGALVRLQRSWHDDGRAVAGTPGQGRPA